jgi:hypothetical protein
MGMKKIIILMLVIGSLIIAKPIDSTAKLVYKDIFKTSLGFGKGNFGDIIEVIEKESGELDYSHEPMNYDGFDNLKLENEYFLIKIPYRVEGNKIKTMYEITKERLSKEKLPKEMQESMNYTMETMAMTIINKDSQAPIDFTEVKRWITNPQGIRDIIEDIQVMNRHQEYINAFDYGSYSDRMNEKMIDLMARTVRIPQGKNYKSLGGLIKYLSSNNYDNIRYSFTKIDYTTSMLQINAKKSEKEISIFIPFVVTSANWDNDEVEISYNLQEASVEIYYSNGEADYNISIKDIE